MLSETDSSMVDRSDARRLSDGTDADVLHTAGVQKAKFVVAVTDDDETNLRVARLLTNRVAVQRPIVRNPYSFLG